jgi:hypothetical protein
MNTASTGHSALVVTTVPPIKLKERYGFQRADFIWLTEMEREKEAVRPEKLCYEVQRAALRHLDTRQRPVVFLDSLQLVGSYVSFPEMARFVKTVIDAAAERGGTVISSMNTGVLGRSPGAILRKRFDFEVALPSG